MKLQPSRGGWSRRAFLTALAGVSGVVLLGCRRLIGRSRGRALDARERAIVEAVAERLVPSDDLPGAREAGVAAFIDRELGNPHFATFRREVRMGLEVLDRQARERHRQPFVRLSGAAQDELLAAFQEERVATSGISSAHCFDVLLTLTLEGMFSDPAHGGNRDHAGWRLLGMDGHG